jgi:hypothetical protein
MSSYADYISFLVVCGHIYSSMSYMSSYADKALYIHVIYTYADYTSFLVVCGHKYSSMSYMSSYAD